MPGIRQPRETLLDRPRRGNQPLRMFDQSSRNKPSSIARSRRPGARYAIAVNSSHLSAAQRAELDRVLVRQRTYLERMMQRMLTKGFPADDPLWLSTQKALGAMQDLTRVVGALPTQSEQPGWVRARGV